MTNNSIPNLSHLPAAASSATPPRQDAEQKLPADEVTLGQPQAQQAQQPPQPPQMRKLVVSMDVDERLLQPDASGAAPINNLEPVFVEKPEVAKVNPERVPTVLSAQFAPDGGDLLVTPVPPKGANSSFIAVPIEVPNDLLQPTGASHPDGSPVRGVDDFDARLVPHDAVIKKPSDYHTDLQEAYDGGKNDYLPQGYTREVANSKEGKIIEMTGGLVSKLGMVGSGFGNMTLAGWNHMLGLATAGTMAGIGGAIGVLGALDQMRKLANEKGRLTYLKQNYEAGESRQSLLNSAPEAGAAYISALKAKFQAEHALLEPEAELKQYDAAIAKGTKKEEKGKLKEGEAETLAGLRKEQEALAARVEQLKAAAADAAAKVEGIRSQLPADKVAKFDEKLNALAPQLQHYEAFRGDQMSLPQAQIKALEAEGVGVVPMQTPQGIQNVPLDQQIKNADTQMKVQGVSAVASGLGMTCGILATVGIGCPPLLAAAAVLLPVAGMLMVLGKPLAMIGKALWNKMFHKDNAPTPEKAVTGGKAKPEGPKETAAWERSMALRSELIQADKVAGPGYLDSLQKLETTRQAVLRAPSPEEAGKAKSEHQKVALELQQFEQALEKAAPGKVAEFKDSLAGLNDCWAERKTAAALDEQFYKDVLSAGVVTRSAENLGLTDAQAKRVMTNLLQAEFGHRESTAAVTGWQAQNPSQMTPEARMAAILIATSQAIQKGADPNQVVSMAQKGAAQAPVSPEGQAPQPFVPDGAQTQQAPDPAAAQQARMKLEQEMLGLVQRALQGDPQADGELTSLGQAAPNDPQAAEKFQISQAIIENIAHNTMSTLAQAAPEVKAEAKALIQRLTSGDQAAQQQVQDLMQKAQGQGDQKAQTLLMVVDAFYTAGRLGLPTEPQAAPAAEQQTAQA